MAYWLVKSEPSCWSFEDHLKKGTEPWDGVRNHQANTHMKSMQVGDQALFYHSQSQRACVGLLEVCKEWYPDPKDASGRFGMVDFKALHKLPQPVSLTQIKADPRLAHLPLLKQSRLSVVPIDADSWSILLSMANAA